MFELYLHRWDLVPDGEPIVTPTAQLLPVLRQETPAMLKLSSQPDQQRGAALMEWWAGGGAAAVFARDNNAVLIERATGTRTSMPVTSLHESMKLKAIIIISSRPNTLDSSGSQEWKCWTIRVLLPTKDGEGFLIKFSMDLKIVCKSRLKVD